MLDAGCWMLDKIWSLFFYVSSIQHPASAC